MEKTEASWLKYSEYILLTIERLVEAVDRNEHEVSLFREKLVKDLTRLKDGIREDIAKCKLDKKLSLDKALSKIDKLIVDLSSRTIVLEKVAPELIVERMLNKFKEKYITPLHIRVAVISTILGAVGGILVYIIPKLMLRWLSG